MRHRNVSGAALEYHEEGSGEPVVLVHGAPSDYRVWLPHCNALAPHYRAIAYSQRYFGRGDWDDAWPPFGVQTHADDLIALCEDVGGHVHVVAWSYGGHVALTAACARPELFASVLVYEPGVPSYVTDATELAAFEADANAMFGPVFAAVAEHDHARGVRLLLAGSGDAPDYFDGQSAARREVQLDNARVLPLLLAQAAPPAITCEQLRALRPRTTVAWGERTRPCSRSCRAPPRAASVATATWSCRAPPTCCPRSGRATSSPS
ncbi:MAG TPA: alpha/beta hydrolase [Gammaproteobacteria bacterium]